MKRNDRDRLDGVMKNKIQTTMIGAIASIENHFGDLLNHPKYRDIFEELRKSILDLGNKQIRNMSLELKNYDVAWNKYSITLLPVDRPAEGRKENEQQN